MKRPLCLAGIPNRTDLLDEAERLGCEIVYLPGTGEVAVITPRGLRVRINNRRKDGTRVLVSALRHLQSEEHARVIPAA